jgi:NAD-dependent dihydropyrimidine dehydrogenase PreA subunit
MAYIITGPCIGTKDQSCVDVCPVDCIHGSEDDEQYYIDPDTCIDCAACETVCPVNAIFFEDDVPEEWKSYIEKNSEWFKTHETSGAFRPSSERH